MSVLAARRGCRHSRVRVEPPPMRASMRRLALTVLASVALAFALLPASARAHGGDAATAFGHPGDAAKVARTIDIAMSDDMRFAPSSIAVKAGETVRLRVRNAGKVVHELVLGTDASLREHAAMMRAMPDMAHDDPAAVRVAPGDARDLVWTFDHPGRFAFACLEPGHFEAGMRGTLSVR
jgi:uncharacterized cupredoxin-like copper-binding protein